MTKIPVRAGISPPPFLINVLGAKTSIQKSLSLSPLYPNSRLMVVGTTQQIPHLLIRLAPPFSSWSETKKKVILNTHLSREETSCRHPCFFPSPPPLPPTPQKDYSRTSIHILYVPNQQRTLNKLPPELRRRNFVKKHRLNIANRRPNVQNCVRNVYLFRLSFHFACHRWWLGSQLSPHNFNTLWQTAQPTHGT